MNTFKTLNEYFLDRTTKFKSKYAIGWVAKNRVYHYTFSEYYHLIKALFVNLKILGLKKGTKVGIFSETKKEWHFADLATILAGGVVVPVYPTYLADEAAFLLSHSECEMIFVDDDSFLKKIIETRSQLPNLKIVITFCETSMVAEGLQILRLSELMTLPTKSKFTDEEFNLELKNASPTDPVSIIYTSGTTGEPKGAVITQEAFATMMRNLFATLTGPIGHRDSMLTFLPLSHVLGRCDSMLPILFGLEGVYAESINRVGENMSIVRPTIVIGVPRLFEKIHAKIQDTFAKKPFITRKLFAWATEVSNAYFDKIEQDFSPSASEVFNRKLAYKLLFSKIYAKLGGKIKYLVTGGAPLSPEIIRFLRNANFTVLEGYGLTETVAPCFVNPADKQIPGTVGLPMGEVQVAFEEDGEIKLKTKALFSHYYKNEAATREAFDAKGWFKTGDIGELTPDGYLKITDRKKDLIITSGGKNVPPQKIEGLMKNQPHIADFMVVGDKRKFLVAIVGISKEAFLGDLKALCLPENCTHKELWAHPKVKEIVGKEIETVNRQLANFETIKKFYISPEEFTTGSGFLTPSMKVKRKVLLKYFEKEIDQLYTVQ